jgi:universal stress protein A
MRDYKHVLVAVELIPSNDAELIKRAESLAREFKSNIVLVHAIEHIGGYSAYGMGVGFEVEQVLIDSSNKQMKALGARIGIPEDRQVVRVGPAKFIILEEAEKAKTDLIIVGSHGRHGLSLLLGSTANAVLHGAKCDVLAVRLKE